MLTDAAWRHVAWRQGTKGPLAAEFAARRVRPAEGEQLRNGQHAPGEEVCLVGERRATGEHKYYLSNLPVSTPLEMLAATVKAALGRLLPAVPAGRLLPTFSLTANILLLLVDSASAASSTRGR